MLRAERRPRTYQQNDLPLPHSSFCTLYCEIPLSQPVFYIYFIQASCRRVPPLNVEHNMNFLERMVLFTQLVWVESTPELPRS